MSVGIGAAEATSDEDRARDALWEAGYDTFYNAYYQEILASTLAARWSRFDAVSRTLVALTTSGSAVTGWALWNEPGFRWVWALLAGVSALLSTIHAVIDVPGKLKLQGDLNRLFSALRIDLETYRSRMTFQPHFNVNEFEAQYLDYRKRYARLIETLSTDLLSNRRLHVAVQDELDRRVAGQ